MEMKKKRAHSFIDTSTGCFLAASYWVLLMIICNTLHTSSGKTPNRIISYRIYKFP